MITPSASATRLRLASAITALNVLVASGFSIATIGPLVLGVLQMYGVSILRKDL
jgi:hypothetical protein